MKPVILIAIIIVAIVGIILALITYSYTQIQISFENISYQGLDISISSGTISKALLNGILGNWLGAALDFVTGVKLGLGFVLSNHGFVPVYIPNISYDLLINDVKLGQGQITIDKTINPGQTQSIVDNQDIQFNSLKPTASSIIDSGGILNLKVSGTAYFNFLGLSVPVPFGYVKQVNVVDELKSHIFGNQQSSPQSSPAQQFQSTGQKLQAIQNNYQPPSSVTIVNNFYTVSPKTYSYISFSLPCTASVSGAFAASASLGNNIMTYVLDQNGYNQFSNNQQASTYYNSGKVPSGSFNLTLQPGQYYIILSNAYSSFSTKTVSIHAFYTCN